MSARRFATMGALVACAAAFAGTSRASAAGTLQPGAVSATDTGRCTLNFVYADSLGSRYFGSAAHCVSAPGQQVRDKDGALIGTVALTGNPDVTAEDWSFIKIDPSAMNRVSAQMKGNPKYPTGVTTASQTRLGDVLQLSGFGTGFDLLALTQERRVGLLISDDTSVYRTVAPLIFGDSGGPLVQTRSGKALGIVSRLCLGICTEEGATVEGILAKPQVRARGMRLVTVSGALAG